MPDVIKEWFTVDNLVKVLVAGVIAVGGYLWNDINSQFASLDASVAALEADTVKKSEVDKLEGVIGKVSESADQVRALAVAEIAAAKTDMRAEFDGRLDRLEDESHDTHLPDERLLGLIGTTAALTSTVGNLNDHVEGLHEGDEVLGDEVTVVKQDIRDIQTELHLLSQGVTAGHPVGVVRPTSNGNIPEAPAIPGVGNQ